VLVDFYEKERELWKKERKGSDMVYFSVNCRSSVYGMLTGQYFCSVAEST
jgi:hypothetical protein